MTRMLGIVLAASLSLPSSAFAGDLTLRDVIELHRSGLGDDLLIAVIEADGGPFRLNFADIHDLASDGLSERVITALVRTGIGRSDAGGDYGVPVVEVQQEVIDYVVPAVVVFDAPYALYAPDARRHGDRDGSSGTRHDRDSSHRRDQPPPAMWVTRQSDGRNVTADGEVRRRVPPAAWVTPRDPEPDRAPRPDRTSRPDRTPQSEGTSRADDAPRRSETPRSRR